MKKVHLILMAGICLWYLHFPGITSAAGGHVPTGAREAGMGRTSVAHTGFWSCFNNQAGMALANHIEAGISYESRFLMKQLSTKSVGVIIPARFGVLGGTFEHFGYELYQEIRLGIAYARSFSPYFRCGIQLDYLYAGFGEEYGNQQGVTVELGVQSDLNEKLTIGAWVYNPVRRMFTKSKRDMAPAALRIGIRWQVFENFNASVEAEKSSFPDPLLIRAGCEYILHGQFFFRGGFTTTREIFSMGFGFSKGMVTCDLSAIMHETLGFSPQASLLFSF